MMLRRLKEDVEKNIAPKEETIIEVCSSVLVMFICFVSLWFKGMWVLYIELGLYVLWQTPPFLCQLWLLRSSSTWPCFCLSQKSKRNKAGWKSWQVAKAVAQNRIVVRERDGLTLDWPSFYLPMFQKWGVTCVVCHWNIATYNIAKTSCIKNY